MTAAVIYLTVSAAADFAVLYICFCEEAEGCLRFVREFPWSMFGFEPGGCDIEHCVCLNRGESCVFPKVSFVFGRTRKTACFSGFLIGLVRNTRRRVTPEFVLHTEMCNAGVCFTHGGV